MIRQIFAAEINFENTTLAIRKEFTGSETNIKRILKAIRPRVDEVYALGNDHRFTVYAVHDSISPLKNFFIRDHNLKDFVQFYYTTEESVTHLFAAASGLLSQIKGEPQVLHEMTKSHHWASESVCLGITLDQTLRKAFQVGKAVRTATGIDKFCSSVVETGMQLLYNKFDNLHSKSFLIVGTGKVARLSLKYLAQEGMHNIVVTGFNHDRVLALAKQFGVKSALMVHTDELFLQSDVIIGASHQLVKVKECSDLRQNGVGDKPGKIRCMLDFGIPRNFAPELAEAFQAELYNLDDLRRIQQSPLESFGGLELAWSMVMKESHRLATALEQLQYSPVLKSYLSRVFILERPELNLIPRESLLSLQRLKKFFRAAPPFLKGDRIDRTLFNNHRAENPADIVKHIQAVKKFTYYFENN